jgi:hypothetical protein
MDRNKYLVLPTRNQRDPSEFTLQHSLALSFILRVTLPGLSSA